MKKRSFFSFRIKAKTAQERQKILRGDDKPPQNPDADAGASGGGSGSDAGEKSQAVKEHDPTRYGDWQQKGRCVDF